MVHQVALVGGQTMPVVLLFLDTALREPVKSLTLLHSDATRREAEQVERALAQCEFDSVPEITSLPVNAYDPASVGSCVEGLLGERRPLIVDLTAGTKLMCIGAFQAATTYGATWTYLDMQHEAVICSDASEPRPLDPRVFELIDVETHLAAQGLKVRTTPFDPKQSNEARAIAQQVADAWSQDDLKRFHDAVKGDLVKVRRKPRLWTLLEKRGWIQASRERTGWRSTPTDKIPWPPNRAGGWLEDYVAAEAAEIPGVRAEDVCLGSETDDRGSQNELDVMFSYRGNLVAVECKAGNVTGRDVLAREALRLRGGGRYSRAGLVCGSKTRSPRNRANGPPPRAEELGMFTVVKEELPKLREKLEEHLSQRFPRT